MSGPIRPKQGDLRVWWASNPPSPSEYFPVASPENAIEKMRLLALRDIRQGVEVNAGGLQVFNDGEWEEWYSEEGEDIDEYWRTKEESKP